MLPQPSLNDLPDNGPIVTIRPTVETVLENLNQWDGTPNIVNLPIWQQISTVLSGFMEEVQPHIEHMKQLLDRLSQILNKLLDENTPINNRRILLQSLHSLSRSPSCDRNVKRRVDIILPLLDDISDTNLVLVEKASLDSLERQNKLLRDENTRLKTLVPRTEQKTEIPLKDVEGSFDLTVKSAVDPTFELTILYANKQSRHFMQVRPQNTILQIKRVLAVELHVSTDNMFVVFDSDDLSDSTTLGEIEFKDLYQLVVIVNEPDDTITITILNKVLLFEKTQRQQLTISTTITIEELQTRIAKQFHVPPKSMRMVWNGQQLSNPKDTVAKLGIRDGSCIDCTPHLNKKTL